jgi:transcriptional regulator with XRE-family HTH domain
MDRRRLRLVLVEQEKRLVDLHRVTGISYNRLVRVANGYCEPRDEELEAIAEALQVPAAVLKTAEP